MSSTSAQTECRNTASRTEQNRSELRNSLIHLMKNEPEVKVCLFVLLCFNILIAPLGCYVPFHSDWKAF